MQLGISGRKDLARLRSRRTWRQTEVSDVGLFRSRQLARYVLWDY